MRNPLYSGKVGTLQWIDVLAAAGAVNAACTNYIDMETCRSGVLMCVLNATGGAAHDVTLMELWDCDLNPATYVGNWAVVDPPGVNTGAVTVKIQDIEGDGASPLPADVDWGNCRSYLVHIPHFRRYCALKWTDVGGAASYFGAWLLGIHPVQAPLTINSDTY